MRSKSSVAVAMLVAAYTPAAQAALEISAKPTKNMTCSAGVCTATSADAVLNAGELANMLAGGDLTIKSGNLAQDMEIHATISWTSTSRLTLDAYHAIAFNKPVKVMGAGALTITTNDGGRGGDFRFFEKGYVKFSDINSNLVINGNHYALAKSIAQIKKLIHRGRGERYIALAKKINASAYEGGVLVWAPAILEGLGNTISNLTISSGVGRSNVGLFAQIGEVRDLGLLNVNIVGYGGEQRVGAIAGDVYGAILNSYVTGKVSATTAASRVGGLAGSNVGTIEHSWSGASIAASSNAKAAGGVVGQNDGTADEGFSGTVKESYSVGTVTGGDNVMTGGLVGYNLAGTISDSYASSPVAGGNNSFAGGLVGANLDSDGSAPKITTSYSTGSVSGGSGAMIGGLIGEDLAQTGMTNSYWDLDTSGISDPAQGAGNAANDPGITGLTTQQFISGLPAGFSTLIWREKAKIDGGFPYLIDDPPPN